MFFQRAYNSVSYQLKFHIMSATASYQSHIRSATPLWQDIMTRCISRAREAEVMLLRAIIPPSMNITARTSWTASIFRRATTTRWPTSPA